VLPAFVDGFVQTMGSALVEGFSKQKKSNTTLWIDGDSLFVIVLDIEIIDELGSGHSQRKGQR
jgi:hypothetical protein